MVILYRSVIKDVDLLVCNFWESIKIIYDGIVYCDIGNFKWCGGRGGEMLSYYNRVVRVYNKSKCREFIKCYFE